MIKNKKVKISAAAILAVIITTISINFYLSYNKYEILFSGLNSAESQIVLNALNEEKIESKINGNSILVQKGKVDELRLKIAPTLAEKKK